MAARILLEDGTSALLAENSDTIRREETFFDDVRQAIISGLDSAQSEGTGWDAEVKAVGKLEITDVVRTSNTVVTVTLSAQSAYNITAQETITATIPAAAVLFVEAVVAAPTFTIAVAGGGGGTTILRQIAAHYYGGPN
jgi:hypothetical protein